jgi:hypothetical protein
MTYLKDRRIRRAGRRRKCKYVFRTFCAVAFLSLTISASGLDMQPLLAAAQDWLKQFNGQSDVVDDDPTASQLAASTTSFSKATIAFANELSNVLFQIVNMGKEKGSLPPEVVAEWKEFEGKLDEDAPQERDMNDLDQKTVSLLGHYKGNEEVDKAAAYFSQAMRAHFQLDQLMHQFITIFGPYESPSPSSSASSVASPVDYPVGIKIPGSPGRVRSPYSPTKGEIDVSGYQPGAEVIDPYSGKIFLVP